MKRTGDNKARKDFVQFDSFRGYSISSRRNRIPAKKYLRNEYIVIKLYPNIENIYLGYIQYIHISQHRVRKFNIYISSRPHENVISRFERN